MNSWTLEPIQEYLRSYRKYDKKHKNELVAILTNLHDYRQALDEVGGAPAAH